MCEIELVHIRFLFGFPCRAAIIVRPRASSYRQRRFRTDRDTR